MFSFLDAMEFRVSLAVCVIVFLAPVAAWAADENPLATGAVAPAGSGESQNDAEPESEVGHSKWFFHHGNANNHPRLSSADKRVEREINDMLGTLAWGFDDVETFGDQSDEFMIWTPFVGFGRVMGPRWGIFFQTGYSAGSVVTRATDPSIFLFPVHTDVEIDRSSFYVGTGIDFYPLGLPEMREYKGVGERLKNAKPFLSPLLNWNYLTADAKIKAGPAGLFNFVDIKQEEDWSIWSAGMAVGAEMPLDERDRLAFNVSYAHFFKKTDDFSGPTISFYWKRYFGGGRR